jgi:hypothetical protein
MLEFASLKAKLRFLAVLIDLKNSQAPDEYPNNPTIATMVLLGLEVMKQ